MDKHPIGIKISEDAIEKCDREWNRLGFESRSEFMNKAIEIYNDYINLLLPKENIQYDIINGLERLEKKYTDRLSVKIFDRCVDFLLAIRMIERGIEFDKNQLKLYQEECIQAVKDYQCSMQNILRTNS